MNPSSLIELKEVRRYWSSIKANSAESFSIWPSWSAIRSMKVSMMVFFSSVSLKIESWIYSKVDAILFNYNIKITSLLINYVLVVLSIMQPLFRTVLLQWVRPPKIKPGFAMHFFFLYLKPKRYQKLTTLLCSHYFFVVYGPQKGYWLLMASYVECWFFAFETIFFITNFQNFFSWCSDSHKFDKLPTVYFYILYVLEIRQSQFPMFYIFVAVAQFKRRNLFFGSISQLINRVKRQNVLFKPSKNKLFNTVILLKSQGLCVVKFSVISLNMH